MQEFNVGRIGCGGCIRKITSAVKALDAGATVEVDIEGARVRVASAESATDIARAISDAGLERPTDEGIGSA